MCKVNNNLYFNVKTPLFIISTGSFGALYEVYKRVANMKKRTSRKKLYTLPLAP
jgi:hypothetical protein